MKDVRIEKWLSAEQYMKLLNEMEQMVNSYPFYDLGYDCHQVTYHPSFIYYNPCPAIYFLRCEQEREADVRFSPNQERFEGVHLEEAGVHNGRSQEQSVDSLHYCELLFVRKGKEPSNAHDSA